MVTWEIEKLDLPLLFPWKIARGTVTSKNNFIISVSDGKCQGIGETAFNVRFGESLEAVVAAFERFQANWDHEINDLTRFQEYIDSLEEFPKSLRFGVESAWIHYLCDFHRKEIPSFLGTSGRKKVATSFSLPILDIPEIGPFIEKWKLQRFKFLKVKVGSGSDVVGMIKEILNYHPGPFRIDFNECLTDADTAIALAKKLADYPIEILEQPFPAMRHDLQNSFFQKTPLPVFADEYLTNQTNVVGIEKLYHGVNVKLMKAGGYLTAIKQARSARALGLKTMIGCMVETDRGIYSALQIADLFDFFDLDGFLFIKDRPKLLVEEDQGYIFTDKFS